jgi:CheY-like chemotaxis protein
MAGKRALIVDDSRSARVILSRMLESYGLQVDTAETAEQALEFLGHTRPDVIFMDHLMPGMDGFQAVQAIKANPDTAVIPVMMYTSQEGELYVSQARALGAVGVLPKTVKQVDVSRVLYQLHLLPDRRQNRSALFTNVAQAANEPATASAAPGGEAGTSAVDLEATLRPLIGQALKEQHSELRRFLLASFEAFARRIVSDMRPAANAAPAEPVPAASTAMAEEPPVWRWPLIAGIAALALLPSLILGLLYLRSLDTTEGLAESNARLADVVSEQQSRLAGIERTLETASARTAAAEAAAANAPVREVVTVPYGEIPLAGARLEALRRMIGDLVADGFRGTVRAETFIGDFCLEGSGIEGFSVAPRDLSAQRCDLIGNPVEESLNSAQRQSLDFANLVATVEQQTGGAIRIEIEHGGRRPLEPYPLQSDSLTAGDWNAVAQRNNRVEFTAEPVS